MAGEICDYHTKLSEDIASIKTAIEYIKSSFASHVQDAEKPGGRIQQVNSLVLDVAMLKEVVSTLKKSYWKVGLTSGLVGALIGHLTPSSIKLIATFLKLHLGV